MGATAVTALHGVIPELVLNADGAPETPLSTDDKALVEHALCRVLYRLIEAAGDARVAFMSYVGGSGSGKSSEGRAGGAPSLPRLLDLSLFISEAGICDHGVVFTVLEQLVEACTISDCERVFTWVESRRGLLSADALWKRGKLIMLRTCNELLRRLSKTHDTVLRGRVLLLLSSLYALSERSALNLAGNYNRANITALDEMSGARGGGAGDDVDMGGGDEGHTASVVDTAFYKTFWSLQIFFQQPPVALGTPGGWDTFFTALTAVLDNFETHQLDHQSVGGGMTSASADVDVLGPKYLTAAPLLQLQLRDPTFRRHFLVQCAILLGFCDNPPAASTTQLALKVDTAQVATAKARVEAQLAATGAGFAAAVSHIMDRERGWVAWKKDNCKDFERPAQPPVEPPAPAPVMRRRPRAGAAAPVVPFEKRVKLGNPELDRLWNLSLDNMSALGDKKGKTVPALADFLAPVIDDMDPEAMIEEPYKTKNDKVYVWKALRLVAKENLAAFSRLGTEDMEAVVPGLLGVEPPGKTAGGGAGEGAAEEDGAGKGVQPEAKVEPKGDE